MMLHARAGCLGLLALLLAPRPTPAADDPTALAQKAREVLQAHCQRCHDADGKAKGGFDYVAQLDRLVARGKVVPGRAAESELVQRVRDGDMPPRSQKTRPNKDEVAALERWINAGAPSGKPIAARRFVAEGDTARAVRADLEALPEAQRKFARYFTLAPLANGGRPDEEIDAARHGLSKLVNALSWHPRITRPVAVDEAALLYRIDLRDYKWNARLWDRVASVYPYRQNNTSREAKESAALTGSEQPFLRGDWFIATASRAPLYYDLLQMPGTDRGVERLLQVDAAADIQEQSVVRAGFNGSGVSKNNRVLERHDAGFGAYWRTYDFSDNTEKQNIFDHPLGPPPGASSFVPAGGEAIFHLPNGLHGYLLLDRNGRRVDKGPVEIVSDPQRPDRAVEAGLSCMSCHARGFLPKADQVRAHVLKNAQAFTKEQVETVKAIYPKETRFKALLDSDNERYLKALAATGVEEKEAEPVNAVTLRYEGVVDLASAAAEAGLTPDEFQARLAKSAALNRVLGPLQVKGGTVQRQTFQTAFADLVREFRLGDAARPAAAGERPFTGHVAPILCVAFSPDGKRVATGSEDKTVRVWDVETGKELKRFEGHTGAVTAVAFARADQVLSGSADRTVRLWDIQNGKELKRFEGHTDRITALAVYLNSHALTGDAGGTIRWWDLATGKEVRSYTGHTGAVHGLAFDPYGAMFVSAGQDGTIRKWDTKGAALLKWEGHSGPVLSVLWGEGIIVSGGNDRTVRVWDLYQSKELHCLKGHANAVVRVSLVLKGKHEYDVLSGSSRYQNPDTCLRRWDPETGKEVAAYAKENQERVSCVAFSPDGKRALTDGPDNTLRLWKLDAD